MPPRDKKIVLLTGASAGLGASLARALARDGHDLILTARREERLRRLADELAADSAERGDAIEVQLILADLDDPDAPARIVSEAVARFGGFDVLINNAGFGLPTLFADANPDDVRRQLEVNLVAPLMLTRHAMPYLLERRGLVINIGSAITCVANSALGAYGATKAGLAYWNDALRRELRHKGVGVCLVEPGPVKTEFFSALEKLAPAGGEYNPMLDAPSPWMTAEVDVVARRIAGLIRNPRRRLSVLRRFVWPFRVLGGLFQACPWLGDLALSTMAKHFDKKGDLCRLPAGSLGDARPAE
jgi:short-subunit dehydrogenase